MWTYWICDTRTGVKQLQVHPSTGTYARAINSDRSGEHTFALGERKLPRATWRELTTPWARTLVVCWDNKPLYAGVITKRPYSADTKTLTLGHTDIRAIFRKRFPFGANSYWADSSETIPGQLVCTNLSQRAIAARVVQQGLIGPTGNYSLPIVLPSTTEAGPFSVTYFNYNFAKVYDILDGIQKAEGGPEIEFDPRWSTTDTLEWVMRTGTPTAPMLDGPTFEWNMTTENPGVTGTVDTEDAESQATGVFSIGSGSEQDLRVGGAVQAAAASIPALDLARSNKLVDNQPELAGYSRAALTALQTPTRQWDLNIIASGYPGADKLKLGATLRLYFNDDPWEEDGYIDLRLVGFSGDVTEKIKLTVQPVGGNLIDDLDREGFDDLFRRLGAMETGSPAGQTSVTRGTFRVGGTAVLLVDSTGGVVIHGTLNGDGTITWTGTLTNNGATHLNGPVTVDGALAINGPSTLNGNLTVAGGGRIKVGVMTLDPTGGEFGGALVSANAVDVVAPSFHVSGNIFSQGTITANMLLRAEVNASVGSDLTVGGKITNTNMPTTPAAGKTANVWQDPSTKILYRMI